MPEGAARSEFFSLVRQRCTSGPLSCIVQEIAGQAFGTYSTVTMVFKSAAQALPENELEGFAPPTEVLDCLPFPAGVQLLQVMADSMKVTITPETNPTRKEHSKSGVF